MVVLGFIIALIAVALGAGVLLGNRSSVDFSVFGLHIDRGVTGSVIFLAGMLAMFLLLLGLWMMKRGMGRSIRKRREVKQLRNRAEEAEAERQAEREAQARRKAEEREAQEQREVQPVAGAAGTAPGADGPVTAGPVHDDRHAGPAVHEPVPAHDVAPVPHQQPVPGQQAPQHVPPQPAAQQPVGSHEPAAPPAAPYQTGPAGAPPAGADQLPDDGQGRHAR